MAASVASLHSQTSLKAIFRTLQNQAGDIFSDVHNAHGASITTCLENLGQFITPDNEDNLDDLRSFIETGVCRIVRNYDVDRSKVSPDVLNFLMTAIRSYNHIVASGASGGVASLYRFESETCQGASATGNAFLTQILVPFINAGALHVFPIGVPLEFEVKVPVSFIVRSPSPENGPRRPSISFGLAVKAAKTARRRYRRQRRAASGVKSMYVVSDKRVVSDSSASGSSSNSNSNSNGGRGRGSGRRRTKRRPSRTLKYGKKTW